MLVKQQQSTAEDESDTIVQAVLKMSLTPNNHDDSSNSVAAPVEPRDPSEAEFSREENRLATFEPQDNNSLGWPPNAKMEPRKIAKAGLFYTGTYYCLYFASRDFCPPQAQFCFNFSKKNGPTQISRKNSAGTNDKLVLLYFKTHFHFKLEARL